ncbi:RNA polymerase [Wenzhou Myotis davidii paramyxovirus 1]|uniref:RNA-directed RNA polymerase L n=1 Tax=Wenzhou Myotis davidii paramyxovirus 1 TaxID=2928979 RepID=A0A8T9KM62_9MONO|nr:RNA polymerase [Wenzhou Myotis davidii paramyxovirus 1]WPV62575.1 MAG: RNA-dependent RNA polymerase [Wenzhou bat jeilongvirus 1]
MGTQSTSDIIYPECHLDSPIVSGKLAELVFYTGLPSNIRLGDSTIIRNLKSNVTNGRRSYTYTSQNELGNVVRQNYPNIKKINHIEYPSGNYELFRKQSYLLTKKFTNILMYGGTCYRKITSRLIKLRKDVCTGLGMTSKDYEHGEHNMHEIRSIEHLNEIMAGSKWFNPFCYWFTIKTEMRDLIKNSRRDFKSTKSNVLIHHVEDHSIFLNRNLVIIINHGNYTTHYLTFEMVLLMCDVAEGRLMIDLGMSSDYRFNQLKPKGYKLWEFIDSQFEDLGNNTYDLVAMIEPLVLGFLQLRDPSDLLCGAFLQYCMNDLIDIYKSKGYTNESDLNQITDIIFDIFDIDDIHMISEFFSFFRTFGHPTLEAWNAAEKVRSHMNKPKVVKFLTMMKGHALYCSTIINGYRDRHGGAWPPVILPAHASDRIKQAQNNSEGLTDDLVIRNWKSFSGIKFKCFMPLTLDEDLTMYMKDKALAALKSEWDSVYPKEVMSYDPPRQTSSRRLVEVFLSDRNFDPSTLINYVISGEYLEDNEFNISYSLKEKEIKQVGRLFAKMTYKMRACQVVAESLIATGIGKYFKENGMTKNEHDLLKTLHKLSVSSVPKDNKLNSIADTFKIQNNEPGKNNNYVSGSIQYETVSTFLTTDLQKFCLNWRQETTNLFAERLNEIYGLPGFFNWQHKILEKSVLYVADPHCPPNYDSHIDLNDVVNDHIYIKYPMGGIEGYSQKLWTITTIPFLFLSAYEIGAKIAAVVQGDNQAIAITMRVHPNLPYKKKKTMCSQLAQQFFYRLRDNLGDIGHNLKANETIVSSNFFVYSKRIYYDGVVLSQSLKPLSRVVFWSETIVDETRSACSNISTAVSKSIEQGFSRWIGYCINLLKIIQQLLISLKFTINPSLTADVTNPIYQNVYWIISAALVPSQIGGFNYMNLSRLYVRNIGDPVTASFADLKRLITAGLLNQSILQKILHQKPGQSSYLDWSSDPYSVNIPHSQSVTTMLKNVTSRTILQASDNPMLRGLFHFDFEKEDNDLAKFLLDRPVIIPRAAHEIMDKSLTGARQEIAGMLDSTKGLIRNSIRAGGVSPGLLSKISLYDYEQFRVFNDLMKNKEEDKLITVDACSVRLAITLRKKMWRDLAQGRQIYGLEVPDSLEVIKGYFLQECADCYYCTANQNQYGWFFCPKKCELDAVNHETNSIRVPYFGSTTEERSEIKLSNVKNASRALKSAIRIATVYTWAFGDSDENWEEAWYLASFRANVTLDELKAITPISTSNNIAHRLRDKSTQMKYSSTALNRVGRYVTISNDNLNFIIDGRKVDTNLVYQQIMLTGLSILEEVFRFSLTTGEKNTVLHLHIQKECCVQEMTDHPYIESNSILPVLQRVEGNRLIYDSDPIIEKTKNIITQQVYKSGVLDFPRWTLPDLNSTLSKSLAATLIEIITKENRDHLSEFKTLSSDDDINSLITEFLLISPEEFSLDLGLYIAVNWAYDIYYRRPQGKYQMLDYISTIFSQSSRSLFSVISNAISHPKIFQKFWDSGLVEPIYGANLSSQDFTRISIDLLIKSYQSYLNYWLDGESIDYILSESDEEVIDQRFENIQAKHLCMVASLYLERSTMPKILNMTSIEKCALLTDVLQQEQFKNGIYSDWNLDPLDVINYPASITYIRRGTIKHIRLRQSLSSEAIALDKLLSDRQPIKEFHPAIKFDEFHDNYSHFFPITALYTTDYIQLQQNPWSNKMTNYWENHISRRVGINSTSCHKALEISHYIKDKLEKTKPRMYLGEGSGAMMITYYIILGKTLTYYNTGVFNREVMGQRILTVHPAEALMVERQNPLELGFSRNLKTLFNGKPESSWVGSDENFAYIMSQVESHSLSLIHSDMESTPEKDQIAVIQEQTYAMALAINLGHDKSLFITKLAPQENSYTTQFLNILTIYYEEVFGFIPASSNPYSTEFYIICSYPRVRTIVSPHIIMSTYDFSKPDNLIQVGNIIANFKIKTMLDKREKLKRVGDYSKSDLLGLTKDEKMLLSIGFQLNGPKCMMQLVGYDIGSGEYTLIESIRTLLNNIIIAVDDDRESTPFFDPYPLRDDSKLREMMNILTKKVNMLFLITENRIYEDHKKMTIQNLRRKSLVFDLNDEVTRGIFPKSILSRFSKTGLKTINILLLETAEVKVWWKCVGYTLLLRNSS